MVSVRGAVVRIPGWPVLNDGQALDTTTLRCLSLRDGGMQKPRMTPSIEPCSVETFLKTILRSGVLDRPTFHIAVLVMTSQIASQKRKVNLVWRRDRLMSGGGPAMDSGFHYCDSIRYLLGDVEKVYAELRDLNTGQPRTLEEAREDTLFATLTFKSGVVGTWSWGTAAPGLPLVNVVFYGSEGSVHDTSDPSPSIHHRRGFHGG